MRFWREGGMREERMQRIGEKSGDAVDKIKKGTQLTTLGEGKNRERERVNEWGREGGGGGQTKRTPFWKSAKEKKSVKKVKRKKSAWGCCAVK
jgi:hypothetical protein